MEFLGYPALQLRGQTGRQNFDYCEALATPAVAPVSMIRPWPPSLVWAEGRLKLVAAIGQFF